MKEDIQIEVQDDHLLVIFPRKLDEFITPYQEAWVLGEVLEEAAGNIPNKVLDLEPTLVAMARARVRLNRYKDNVVVILDDHVDRIKLSYECALLLARSIRRVAQDVEYEIAKGVYFKYDVAGREGRPTPFWDGNRLPKTIPTR